MSSSEGRKSTGSEIDLAHFASVFKLLLLSKLNDISCDLWTVNPFLAESKIKTKFCSIYKQTLLDGSWSLFIFLFYFPTFQTRFMPGTVKTFFFFTNPKQQHITKSHIEQETRTITQRLRRRKKPEIRSGTSRCVGGHVLRCLSSKISSQHLYNASSPERFVFWHQQGTVVRAIPEAAVNQQSQQMNRNRQCSRPINLTRNRGKEGGGEWMENM